jgi:hypothetical protein
MLTYADLFKTLGAQEDARSLLFHLERQEAAGTIHARGAHTPAYVSIRQHTSAYAAYRYIYICKKPPEEYMLEVRSVSFCAFVPVKQVKKRLVDLEIQEVQMHKF